MGDSYTCTRSGTTYDNVTEISIKPWPQYVKELLHKIYGEVPGADKRLFRAVIDGNIPGWPPANPNPRYNK